MIFTGITLNFVSLELMPVHIRTQLNKEESRVLLQHCPECANMQVYYNANPTITNPLFFTGFFIIGMGLLLRFVSKLKNLALRTSG